MARVAECALPPAPAVGSQIQMPAGEFQRICRDLSILGDTVTIAVGKDGVKFSVSGEMGSGNMTLRQNTAVDTKEEDQVEVQFDEPVACADGYTPQLTGEGCYDFGDGALERCAPLPSTSTHEKIAAASSALQSRPAPSSAW